MIYETVRRIVAETLEVDESAVTMESSVKSDLGADSLAFIDLMMNLEEEFSKGGRVVDIPDKKLGGTVGDYVQYIESLGGWKEETAQDEVELDEVMEEIPA